MCAKTAEQTNLVKFQNVQLQLHSVKCPAKNFKCLAKPKKYSHTMALLLQLCGQCTGECRTTLLATKIPFVIECHLLSSRWLQKLRRIERTSQCLTYIGAVTVIMMEGAMPTTSMSHSDSKCPIGKGSVETMSHYFLKTWRQEMIHYTPTRVMSHIYFLEGDNVAYT